MSVSLDEIRSVRARAERLCSPEEVERAIDRMAAALTARLGSSNPLVLTVLNGGVIFAGHLLSRLDFPLELDSLRASRYGGATRGSHIKWLVEPKTPLEGRSVLVVDDVLDEGVTLAEILAWCRARGAREVLSAVLVEKELGKPKPCTADFVGLRTDDRYQFGYGMDYKGYWRNAPGIFAVNP
jgi:hypoxanthine phosphoribosyltransferase